VLICKCNYVNAVLFVLIHLRLICDIILCIVYK